MQSFRIFKPRKIEFGFLALQTVSDNILCHHGGNEFKIEHIGKNDCYGMENWITDAMQV